MAGPSIRPDRRVPAHRNALFELSVLCSQSGQGGVASEAVELLLGALGLERGALFDIEGDELVLVSQSGMTATMRDGLERVAVGDRSWFPAARVAGRRKLICARPGIGGPILPEAMVMAGWGTTCAVPLLIGRRAIGVMVFGADSEQPFDEETRIFLQTASGMLALTFALRQERERVRDATEGVAWRKSSSRGRADANTATTRAAAVSAPASRRKGTRPVMPTVDAQDRKSTVQHLRVGRGPNAATVPEMPASARDAQDDKKTVPPAGRRRGTAGRRPSGKKTVADMPAERRRATQPPSSRATQELPASKKKS